MTAHCPHCGRAKSDALAAQCHIRAMHPVEWQAEVEKHREQIKARMDANDPTKRREKLGQLYAAKEREVIEKTKDTEFHRRMNELTK